MTKCKQVFGLFVIDLIPASLRPTKLSFGHKCPVSYIVDIRWC